MSKNKIYWLASVAVLCLSVTGCKVPSMTQVTENKQVPQSYGTTTDTLNTGKIRWQSFFTDPNLVSLIDTGLKRNQELQVTLQELEIAKSEIRFRQSSLLPSVGITASTGIEKVGRYTSQGAGDASTEITSGKPVPDPLPDYLLGVYGNWEVDIWHKLHNAKKAAVTRYLASIEGRNFVVTNLIAEIANSYYELLALDNQMEIVKKNIELQNNALEIVKVQKQAARTTELAVRKFEAEVLNTKSLQYDLQQKITETENKINFLLGRYPQPIVRSSVTFNDMMPGSISAGIPSQLLTNRPDVRQAELELTAAKLDVKVARAEFYPSLGLSASIGLQAFDPTYLAKLPESLLYNIAADITAPLVNRGAIKAEYAGANAKQTQAVYNYERTLLNAYVEVANQMSSISNLQNSYDLKSRQVNALTQSIDISNDLFRSARADYLEVLLTQRDALEAKLDLIDTKKAQMNAMVNIYQALGGGWN
ncbi:efflux transporter outer membrane subunit [Pedobacter sp. HMF7647]|uniref:Efflux transporter outer membrane subunit n=1 Tax=Hufsiella arboris TaxID=2695275 RepID=A0A7K1YAY7_9SPHI|nr:TolC family protein [Hufsiella arboris]MXV51269.1 efflux transporter outer membrane subunit [Hufsiella arboris]